MTKADVNLYKKHTSKDCLLCIAIGSSEASGIAQIFFDKGSKIVNNIIPVGYVVADKQVFIVDENGQQLNSNQVGEIAVKSPYLSHGYWKKPKLTKAKFLTDPNCGDKRIYLTGDMGRMAPDGCLYHLGRKDFQVKVRGHRIEVSEVEMELLDIGSIKDAAVIVRKNKADEQVLVAYLVSAIQPAPSVSSLRRSLEQKLPGHMIPSRFVMLDALPLNQNNKIDRQALPEPSNDRPELENPFVPPQTPIEQILVEIWSEILDIQPVGIHDRFLELGGNSLLATRMISRVLNTFQVKLSLQSLLAAPTIAEMAVLITQNQAKKVEREELDIMLAELEELTDKVAKEITKMI